MIKYLGNTDKRTNKFTFSSRPAGEETQQHARQKRREYFKLFPALFRGRRKGHVVQEECASLESFGEKIDVKQTV